MGCSLVRPSARQKERALKENDVGKLRLQVPLRVWGYYGRQLVAGKV